MRSEPNCCLIFMLDIRSLLVIADLEDCGTDTKKAGHRGQPVDERSSARQINAALTTNGATRDGRTPRCAFEVVVLVGDVAAGVVRLLRKLARS